jgi:hypothetical protein
MADTFILGTAAKATQSLFVNLNDTELTTANMIRQRVNAIKRSLDRTTTRCENMQFFTTLSLDVYPCLQGYKHYYQEVFHIFLCFPKAPVPMVARSLVSKGVHSSADCLFNPFLLDFPINTLIQHHLALCLGFHGCLGFFFFFS